MNHVLRNTYHESQNHAPDGAIFVSTILGVILISQGPAHTERIILY